MAEYYEGIVKLKPEEYWSIHRHIVNRICQLPSLVALGEMSPSIVEVVIEELGWSLLPPKEYFTAEERAEYEALMDSEKEEAQTALTQALEERGMSPEDLQSPSPQMMATTPEELIELLKRAVGIDDDEDSPF